MISFDKITEIYSLVDEFCKNFEEQTSSFLLGSKSKHPPKMSISEVITISLLFQISGFRTFKHFYLFYVQKHMQSEIPKTVSYNRFVELQQSSLMTMTIFVKTCWLGKCTGISFVDSTLIRVRKNKRITVNKIFDGLAETGKSTMSWFHGFKLHIVLLTTRVRFLASVYPKPM